MCIYTVGLQAVLGYNKHVYLHMKEHFDIVPVIRLYKTLDGTN